MFRNFIQKNILMGTNALKNTVRLGAGLLVLSFSIAHAQISDPDGLITDFSAASIKPFFEEMNTKPELVKNDITDYLIVTDADSGLKIVVNPAACDGGICKGVQMIVYFNDVQIPPERMQHFDENVPFAKVVNLRGDMVMVSRYEFADFGFKRAALMLSYEVLLQIAERARSDLMPADRLDEGL